MSALLTTATWKFRPRRRCTSTHPAAPFSQSFLLNRTWPNLPPSRRIAPPPTNSPSTSVGTAATVSRSLQSLLDRNLATRERRLLNGGGFVYQYSAVDLEPVKDRLHESLDRWTATVHDHIDAFENDRE